MREILSVSALNSRIKALLEERFASLWVEGEVSNLRRPASGHVYFTLKDAKSQIRAVIFRNPFGQWGGGRPAGFAIEEGMSVVCRAHLTVYPPRGEYQLLIDAVEPKGLGALQKAFEQLKARLDAEGLFDPSRKKNLPFLPARIGVVTSPTGAVIRDILTVTRRRFPSVDILIAPVRVQGAEAPAEIIRALDDLQLAPGVDVIILARGGGSLEDLAPFNDEGVARAIARSRLPVISAVGHETDFTIADFTADLRAATPSAAAELAVPDRAKLAETVETLHLRLNRCSRQQLERLRRRIAEWAERLRDPKRRLADIRLALDDQGERMRLAIDHLREVRRRECITLGVRLAHRNPQVRIAERLRQIDQLVKTLGTVRERRDEQRKNRLQRAMGLLDSLSPLAVLNRGYSITRRLPDGLILRRAEYAAPGDAIAVRLAEGSLHAAVTEIRREPKEDVHVQRKI
ncbi:MAG: exodeoxyribonuclease VII large subunit [Deltaproteobacteria bacterium]|nr:exodeoxyribonuclease VII large subunit [Deltaproteobacteria bacterium]